MTALNALGATTCAALLALCAPAPSVPARDLKGRFLSQAIAVIRHPGCRILPLRSSFFAFACQIFSLTVALPLAGRPVKRVASRDGQC